MAYSFADKMEWTLIFAAEFGRRFGLTLKQAFNCTWPLRRHDNFFSDRVAKKIKDYNEISVAQVNKHNERNPDSRKTFTPLRISEEGLETIEMVSLDCTSADSPEWHADTEIKIDAKTSRMIINGVKTQKFWQGYIVSDERPLRMKIRNICGDETIFVLK